MSQESSVLLPRKFLVFDVESIGFLGEAFAVGGVIIDVDGTEIDSFYFACHPAEARGEESDRWWVASNFQGAFNCTTTSELRERFVLRLDMFLSQHPGITVAADCPFPVEAGFLLECKRQFSAESAFELPYPLIDVASVVLANGGDPIGDFGRLENELPKHNPLQDARQSARILVETLRQLR